MKSGVFHDVDELLTQAFHALDVKQPAATPQKPRKRLIDILMAPTFLAPSSKLSGFWNTQSLPFVCEGLAAGHQYPL
jgi:hypothetical protein